jgi:hypothetical protein
MIESMVLVGSGVAIIAGIGAYKLAEHRLRRRIDYVTRRNADLRTRLDAAQRSERDARRRQFIAERDNRMLEAREKHWTKRILSQMTYAEDAGQ